MASKIQVYEALKNAPLRSYGVREEHRITKTLFLQIGARLHQRQIAHYSPSLEHLPFFAIPTHMVIEYLRCNISKYCFGFEYFITRGGGLIISTEESQIALLFLSLLRASYQAYHIPRFSGLWIQQRESEQENHKSFGLGLKYSLSNFHYGFMNPDRINWAVWQVYPHIKHRFLFGIWQLQKPYNKAYQKIQKITSFYSSCDILLSSLSKDLESSTGHPTNLYRSLQLIWKWLAENLVWLFQQEVLTTCKDNFHPEIISRDGWKPNLIYFTVDRLNALMTQQIQLVKTISNGRNIPESPLERLQHIWEFEDSLIRKSWDKKKYRLSYQQVVNLWNKYL